MEHPQECVAFSVSDGAENEGGVYEYKLESLALTNGFAFAPGKLTVIVGPNNSGKSRLLHDVKQLCTSQNPETVVVKEAKYTRPPSSAEFAHSYGIRPLFDPMRNQVLLRTLGADMDSPVEVPLYGGSPTGWETQYDQLVQGMLDQWDLGGMATFAHYFGNYFVTRLTTESRLLLAKEGPSGDPRAGKHNLLRAFYGTGKATEQRLSALVERAFDDTRIKLDYSNLSTLCLRVGKDFSGVEDDPRLAGPKLQAHDTLEEQGDGMRSFVTTALSLLVGNKPVLLLDEPEAFLHPPQAFQLGAVIAEHTSDRRQMIVATHSVDLLRGILSITTDVDLVRLTRVAGRVRVWLNHWLRTNFGK